MAIISRNKNFYEDVVDKIRRNMIKPHFKDKQVLILVSLYFYYFFIVMLLAPHIHKLSKAPSNKIFILSTAVISMQNYFFFTNSKIFKIMMQKRDYAVWSFAHCTRFGIQKVTLFFKCFVWNTEYLQGARKNIGPGCCGSFGIWICWA